MKLICELNEWGFASEEWEALGWRKRSQIRNWAVDRFRKDFWKLCNSKKQAEYYKQWRSRNREKVLHDDRVRQSRRYIRIRAARIEAAKKRHEEREAARKGWITENRHALSQDTMAVYRRIRRALSDRGYPADVKDDVASDIILSLLEGDMPIGEIERSITPYAQEHYRQRDWKKTVSFDAPLKKDGGGSMTLGETISASSIHV